MHFITCHTCILYRLNTDLEVSTLFGEARGIQIVWTQTKRCLTMNTITCIHDSTCMEGQPLFGTLISVLYIKENYSYHGLYKDLGVSYKAMQGYNVSASLAFYLDF